LQDHALDIGLSSDFKMLNQTEQWILTCSSTTQFSVFGSFTGYLPNATIGTQYPEKDWTGQQGDYGFTAQSYPRFEQYPISFKIVNGTTVFVVDDKFTFKTYKSSFMKNTQSPHPNPKKQILKLYKLLN